MCCHSSMSRPSLPPHQAKVRELSGIAHMPILPTCSHEPLVVIWAQTHLVSTSSVRVDTEYTVVGHLCSRLSSLGWSDGANRKLCSTCARVAHEL